MTYLLLICLSGYSGLSCDSGVRIPYATRAECLAAFQVVKDEAPREPVRMYCVTIHKAGNA